MKNLIACGLLLAASAPVTAQTPEEPMEMEELTVIAHPLSAEGLAQAGLVVEGETLTRNLSANIGETLHRLPGVHNSSFGNAAGRPVIRGLSGPRVRIMEDRLDSLDVSVTSADHATTVDAFVADRIEVLKGPSTLLYGSGAIGGVVDVHTGRIPHDRPDELTGGIEARAEDSTEQVSTVGELDFGAGPMAFHVDGFYRDANDYDIPGCVESDELRAAEGGEACEEDGTLPGSELETWGAALGGSWIGDRGFVGIAVSRYDSDYGLPGGHGHEHEEEEGEEHDEEEEEGNPTISLDQTRIDLEAGLENPFRGFSSANLRIAYNDYDHEEIEPNGEVATKFKNKAWDSRFELTHREVLDFTGAIGLQYSDKNFSAVGEEAFIEPVDTTAAALFWVGQRSFSGFDLETGVRVESVEHDPSVGGDDDFTVYSASLGFVIPFGTAWELGLQSDYSERAPVPEELYSDGPHLATNAYEIGNTDLDEEQAINFAATLGYTSDTWYLNASAYYTEFSDFIYQFATGEEEDELPVQQYDQDDATFYGFDMSGGFRAATFDGGSLWLNGMFDIVEAELDIDGNDNVPRLPPWRIGVGASLDWHRISARIDYLYVDEQDDVSEFELPTDDYEDLRIFISTHVPSRFGEFELFVQGKNLTDDEQRYHTSFIKDFAPQPGRTFEGGIRMRF
ncbi:MAG: TonB-dependent receptor [Chromatiales bacterium]|nr:TonB-dependent receptor [Chromatiales bacterium]